MILITLFTFWLITIRGIKTTSVGVIYSASLTSFNSTMTINGSNCNECICQMFNSSMYALNCLINNSSGVTCQLYPNGIYVGFNSSQMKINLNSIFYFRHDNQSQTTTSQNITTILTTTVIMTTTTPVCSASGRGTLISLGLTAPAIWTYYIYAHTALSTTVTLTFGFQTELARTYYLDDLSVTDILSPYTQLLQNPSFENSTTNLTGWTLSCSTTCGGSGPKLYSTSICRSASGTCFEVSCFGAGPITFLSQSFPTTIGHTYTISYWLLASGGGIGLANTENHFYVDVNEQ